MQVLTRASATPVIERLAGGKGRNLHLLDAAGFATPDWVVIGTDVFEHFVEQAGFAAEIADRMSALASETVAETADRIQRRIETAELGEEVESVLRAAYAEIGPGPMAVRSSGTEEDRGRHSFAGQFSTSLGVTGYPEMVRRVRVCWASAFGEGPLHYRLQRGLPADGIGMAVVLQRLVDADRSGVAFTVNPATGATGELVLSAAFGLGEGVVSGIVDADTIIVDRESGEVRQHTVGTKAERVDRAPGGGCAVTGVPEADRTRPALEEGEVATLCETSLALEKLFDGPQDVEWALAGEKLWILQARPVTTVATRGRASNGVEFLWDNSNIIESYGDVTGQLTFTFARHVYHRVYLEYSHLLGIPRAQLRQMEEWLPNMLGYFHGRVYYNLLNWYKIVRLLPLYPVNRRVFEMTLGVPEPLDAEAAGAIRPYAVENLRDRLVSAKVKANFVRRYFVSSHSVDAFLDRFDATFEQFDAIDYDELPADEIYRHFRALEGDFLRNWAPMVLLEAVIITSLGLLFGLTRRWLPRVPTWFYWAVANPGAGLVSAEPARCLSRLAELAHGDPAISAIILSPAGGDPRGALEAGGHDGFLREFDDYVRRFGYRSVNELKLEEPDLAQDPSSLFLMLRGALRTLAGTGAPGTGGEQHDTVESVLREELSRPQRLVFGAARRKVRSSLRDRERVRFCRTKAFGLARRMFLGIGRDLARLGAIEAERDVFHLRLDELRGCFEGTIAHGELTGIVELRKRSLREADALAAPSRFRTRGPVYWGGDLEAAGWLVHAAAGEEREQILRGVPSAPGVVEGEAVVAAAPGEINHGILVTYRTDPGWIGVLPSLKALVIERGSPLTHVAIVARELAIPTIVQVPGVTRKIDTGMRVRVNGDTGELTVLGNE